MQLKDSCRLCLNKEGKFYKLFETGQEECTLADELNSLLKFQITNKDHLPDSICSNCYKINSFFKEFRSNSARINDYIHHLHESLPFDIKIKTEKTFDIDGVSGGDMRESYNEETLSRKDRGPGSEEPPYPVALVSTSYSENLEELRSNFLSKDGLRMDEATGAAESEPHFIDESSRRGKKRKYNNSEDTRSFQEDIIPQDLLLTTVKTENFSDDDAVHVDNHENVSDLEENDADECSVGDDAYSSDLNDARNKRSAVYSGSNLLINSAVNMEPCHVENPSKRAAIGIHKEARIRTKTVKALENKLKRNRENDQNSTSMFNQIDHEVKQEEIDIYDPPLEEINDCGSSDEQKSPDRTYLSDSIGSDHSSSCDVDGDSSRSSNSSEESDEDTEMLLLLAMLIGLRRGGWMNRNRRRLGARTSYEGRNP